MFSSQGDVWAETSMLGFKWHYYACMEGKVFDITEWVACRVSDPYLFILHIQCWVRETVMSLPILPNFLSVYSCSILKSLEVRSWQLGSSTLHYMFYWQVTMFH